MQLVVVGNVGTDHPCQANCAVTAVEVAFFENHRDKGEPMLTKKPMERDDPNTAVYWEPHWSGKINLDHTNRNMSFNWQQNATAVMNIDLTNRACCDDNDPRLGTPEDTGGYITFLANTTYW
jgi:hypothetical protein